MSQDMRVRPDGYRDPPSVLKELANSFMASVYVLFSKKLNRFYTGSCDDLSYRIQQHFNKDFSNSFTAKTDDWELFFFVDDLHYAQARSIEQHVKKMKSKTYIQNLKKYPEIIQKLIVKYS